MRAGLSASTRLGFSLGLLCWALSAGQLLTALVLAVIAIDAAASTFVSVRAFEEACPSDSPVETADER